jgi:hypothetical protein
MFYLHRRSIKPICTSFIRPTFKYVDLWYDLVRAGIFHSDLCKLERILVEALQCILKPQLTLTFNVSMKKNQVALLYKRETESTLVDYVL